MVLFDLDGTLIDSNGIWADVDRAFLGRRGVPYTQEYRNHVAHLILPLAAKYTKESCALSESCEEIIAEWMELAKDSYARVPLKPGARELLAQMRGQGERMAVFTSAVPEHCDTALKTHALEPYFERVIYAHTLLLDKAASEAYRIAAEILGAKPEDCTLFDDSPRSCRAAKEAGFRVYGIYDSVFDNEAEMPSVCDRFLHSLTELL